MFYFSLRFEKAFCLLAVLLTLPAIGFAANTNTPPPVFLDPTPANVTVDCYNDRPNAVNLQAQTESGIVDVVPFDSLSNGASTVCAGGVLFRIWEVSDSEGSARVVQRITFGPTTDGPTLNPTLDTEPDTVECNIVNDPMDPMAYSTWLSNNNLRVISNSIPGCAPIASITHNGDSALERPGCGDVVEVTFTIADQCGQSVQTTFTYVIIDNAAPVLVGVPADTSISCSDAIPAVPNVIAQDCGPDGVDVVFTEVDNQTFDGSCNEFEYEIVRTWTAVDSCGNATVENQTIQVVDNGLPTFTRPFNRTLICTQDWEDLSLAGEPTDLFDNCTPVNELSVTYVDNIIFQPDCNFNFNVRRSWTVTDRCGNTNTQIQNIFVQDDQAPTFVGPEDITVNCEDVFNFPVVGEPSNLLDACTENPNTSFEDNIIPGNCPNNYTIERNWRIFDDCGNDRFFEQIITVIDTTPPVFITEPSDLISTCNNEQNQQQLFANWLADLAGAVARDACSPDDSLTYRLVVSGTNEVPMLPAFSCGDGDQAVRQLDVDVMVTDECGNTTVRTVEYRQTDMNPPNLFDCMESQVISTDIGACFANVAFIPPTITDECVTGLPTQHNSYDTVMVTSNALPGEEGNTPVNAVELLFPINLGLPINALTETTLTITLENADAEGNEEFFVIYGEDGTVLDSTDRSDVQCADVTTTITLTRQQFNVWATDGVVRILLEPNIPEGQSGNFAVNDICEGGTRVLGHLFTPVRRLAPIKFEIIIDGTQTFVVDPIDTLFADLEQGLHQVTYRVTDCAENTDECIFTITVEDNVAPEIICPDDVQVDLAPDSCVATVRVPLPIGAEDNCAVYQTETIQSPNSTTDRLLRFFFDPNLNAFQAGAITANFPPISPYTVDTTIITVRLQGDFSGTSAILDVYDNDDNLLGSSPADITSCGGGEASFNIRIAADAFNTMVADNDFSLRLQPRVVNVPPGQTGDGVNPCMDDPSMQNGQPDGSSFVYVELTYNLLRPDYFTTGATETPLQTTSDEHPVPILTFNQGVTNFNYVITDPAGNSDTCTIEVEVLDVTPPQASCLPTTIFIDPSGLAPVSVDPAIIGGNSSDNCSLDTIILTPATFDCSEIGTTATVTLTAVDNSGNRDSCTTFVSVNGTLPEPTANSGFCGGDTLFLFANPPSVPAPGQTLYTFAWFGPNNVMFSTEENPVIPGIDSGDEGAYRVVITGLTGCSSEGVINVNIEDLPITPVIEAPQSVCIGDPIPLMTNSNFTGMVEYRWFEGEPGAGNLLATTLVPEFDVPAPHGNDGRDFYLQVTVNGCPSGPSTSINVTTVARSTVSVENATVIGCELDFATLSIQPNSNLIFQWEGPNGFMGQGQELVLGPLDNNFAGTYYVRGVENEGCFSEPDSLLLGVIPASPTASLTSNSPVCIGTPLELTASIADAETYVFTAPNGEEYMTENPTLILDESNSGFEGEWRVVIDMGTCPSAPSAPIAVTVNMPPVASTETLPMQVCTGNDIILQGSSNVASSTYNWTGPNDFTSESIAPVLESVSAEDGGMYILTVTAPNGCMDVDTLVVDVLPGVAVMGIQMAVDECLTGGETIGLVATTTPVDTANMFTYTWMGPNNLAGTGDTLFIPDVSPDNSGSYTVVVNDGAGCNSPSSTFIVDLKFAPATPVTPITLDGEIGYCLGENFTLSTNDYGPNVTYFWQLPDGAIRTTMTNEITLNAFDVDFSGNYRVRVVREGCTSLFSEPLEVIITDFPALSATAQSPLCEGSPISLQATDLAGAEYSWRGPNSFSSSLPNPTITTADADIHSGTYNVVVTIGGCSSDTLSVDVDVQPTPAIPVGVPQSRVCIDDADALLNLVVNANTITEGATYQWFTENGTIPVTEPGQPSLVELTDFSLFPNGGLINFFVQADLNGCVSQLSNAMPIQLDIADVDAANAGSDTIVCEGLHLLEANVPLVGSGRWELLDGGGDIFIANPTSSTTAVNGMTEFGSPYRFVWSLSNGECKDYSRDTLTINVTSGEAAIAGPDLLVCLNEEIRLGATPVMEDGSVGRWSQNQAQEVLGVMIVNPDDPNTLIEGLEAGNVYVFTWTVQSNCGTKTDAVLVNVSDPTPFAGEDAIVCNSERSTAVAADEATLGSNGRWRPIDDYLMIQDATSPTTMVNNLMVGENILVWEIDESLCGDSGVDTLTITYKMPSAPVDDVIDVPFQGSVTFNPMDNDEFPDGSFVEIVEDVTIGTLTREETGEYTYQAPPNFVGELVVVYLLQSDGCTASSATITLRIGGNAECTAPNIFTPNNDGVNDFFVVPCLLDSDAFPENELVIYNLWGDEIFRASPYQNNFNGTFNGEPLPVGTYFYHIKFGNTQEEMSGHVRIQR